MIDLNIELRAVDRFSDRGAKRVTRRLKSAIRNSLDVDTTKAQETLQSLVYEVMLRAHTKSVECYDKIRSDHVKATLALSYKTDKLLKNADKSEKEAIAKLYKSIAKSISDQTMSKVRERLLSDVSEVVNKGQSNPSKVVKEIAVNEVSQSLMSTITRTQSSMAFNAAAWASNATDSELWGFEYTTANDERVRASHQSLRGVRYPVEHEFWSTYAPPNGWNCRCGLTPIYTDEKITKIVEPKHGLPDIDEEFKFNPGKLFSETL